MAAPLRVTPAREIITFTWRPRFFAWFFLCCEQSTAEPSEPPEAPSARREAGVVLSRARQSSTKMVGPMIIMMENDDVERFTCTSYITWCPSRWCVWHVLSAPGVLNQHVTCRLRNDGWLNLGLRGCILGRSMPFVAKGIFGDIYASWGRWCVGFFMRYPQHKTKAHATTDSPPSSEANTRQGFVQYMLILIIIFIGVVWLCIQA